VAANLKDIAREAGVSVTTVSRALNGYSDVSEATRRKIERVAEDMGYEPNTTARNLQRRRTDTIGLILPLATELRFSDPFFSHFLTGVVEHTAARDYNLNVSTSAHDVERETYLRLIRSRRFDGFVVVRTMREDVRIDLLREHAVPFVAFGRTDGDNDFHFVDDDGYRAMRQVVDHLVALGHKRFACIAEPLQFTKAYHRVQGFIDGLRSHNLPVSDDSIIETLFRQPSGQKAAAQFLDRPVPPTAILAVNDLLAIGAVDEVQRRGLRVGHDISITGYDDILLAQYVDPPLTTVHQSARHMGELVTEMLLRVINQEPIEEKQIIVNSTLVVRQSSGPCS
jgi:DNA-binding LacI/PurR family transcriptional regulator